MRSLLRRNLQGFCLAALLASGCAAPDSSSLAAQVDGSTVQPSGESVALALRDDAVPRALRAAYIRAAQADASAEFHVARGATQREARNSYHGLKLRFEAERVVMAHAAAEADGAGDDASYEATVELAGVGRDGARTLPRVVGVSEAGARIEYARAGMTEWYANGPLGLEQGFTLERAPAGQGPVALAVRIGGDLAPELADGGQRVELRTAAGRIALQVADLFVADADGRELASWFEVERGDILLRFEDEGARYPVLVDPLIGTLQATVNASDVRRDAWFGASAAMSGDRAIIGSRGPFNMSGAAYIFRRDELGWGQEARLSAGAAGAQFGWSVAIYNNIAVVGAPFDDAPVINSGAVYVYLRSNNTWSLWQTLRPTVQVAHETFGLEVAISDTGNNRIVVGAPTDGSQGASAGAVFVFDAQDIGWVQAAKITRGNAGARFGFSVAVSGDRLIVGEPYLTNTTGAAHALTRNANGVWTWQWLGAFQPSSGDAFGTGVAISGNVVLVGAPGDDGTAGTNTGSVDVYVHNGVSWDRRSHLFGDAQNACAGGSVSLSGSTAVMGHFRSAHLAPVLNCNVAGPIYALGAVGTTSPTIGRIGVAGAMTKHAGFAVSGQTLVLGFPEAQVSGQPAAGLAQIYRLAKARGDACTAASECSTNICIDGVCCNSTCGSGSTSDCQACSIARGALQDGVCGLVAAGRECRAAAGVCDVRETCSGSSLTCPANVRRSAGTSCRAAAGPCDAPETCTGSNDACPGDAKRPAGTPCGIITSPNEDSVAQCTGFDVCTRHCDLQEECNGTANTCPADQVKPAGYQCRSTNRFCDPIESCTGAAGARTCPADTNGC